MNPTALVLLDYFGIAVFAISGALVAAERRLDFFTFVFFAVITGVGGGTLRDLIIGAPVFWIRTNATLLICIVAALLVWVASHRRFAGKALLWFDAAGMAAYAAYGAAKALGYGVAPVPAFAMGVLTACVGGIIRDTLAGEPSVLMRRELYVTPAALSAALLVALTLAGLALWVAAAIAIVAGFTLRGLAIAAAGRCPLISIDAPQHRSHESGDGHRFLPYPAAAALRLRRGERDEGGGARAGRGRGRSRHGQSRRRAAEARHRQARRSREQAARPPLLDQPRHPGPAGKRRRPITSAASTSTSTPTPKSS